MQNINSAPWTKARLLSPALVLIVLVGFACIGIPAYIFFRKVYSWHLIQPETIQGDMELLVVFLGLVLATVFIRRQRIFCIIAAVIAVLYLQLHHIPIYRFW